MLPNRKCSSGRNGHCKKTRPVKVQPGKLLYLLVRDVASKFETMMAKNLSDKSQLICMDSFDGGSRSNYSGVRLGTRRENIWSAKGMTIVYITLRSSQQAMRERLVGHDALANFRITVGIAGGTVVPQWLSRLVLERDRMKDGEPLARRSIEKLAKSLPVIRRALRRIVPRPCYG